MCRLALQQFRLLSRVPPTPVTYPLSLHDALPISKSPRLFPGALLWPAQVLVGVRPAGRLVCGSRNSERSEEHTSELQSRGHLVCRLLLEKKQTPPLRSTRTELAPQSLDPPTDRRT